MTVSKTELPEVLLIQPDIHGDARGFFLELWNSERYTSQGLSVNFVQDNISKSGKGTLRGLHFQHPHGQGKLVTVLEGEVFDVAVDIRSDSPRKGNWAGRKLTSELKEQMYIPPGFAHGFLVLSKSAVVHYKCTQPYRPEHEKVLRWNDPEIGIQWPTNSPLISGRDEQGKSLSEFNIEDLPLCTK